MERRVLPREAEGWVKANCCCNSRRSDVYVLIKERAKSFPYDTSDCFKLQLVGCFSIPRTEVGDGIAQAMLRSFAGRCGGSQGLLPPQAFGSPGATALRFLCVSCPGAPGPALGQTWDLYAPCNLLPGKQQEAARRVGGFFSCCRFYACNFSTALFW